MHLECFLKSSRSFDHFHCCVSASASIQGLAAVGGSDSSWEATPRELVAGGGGGGDNDQSETTYLSNCLLYNKNYSVALSLNSQREGAAGGSWRLCFNQMNKQEKSIQSASLPPFSAWCNNQAKKFSNSIYQSNTAKHLDLTNIYSTLHPTTLQNTNSFYCIRCVHEIDIDWPIKQVTMNIKGLILQKKSSGHNEIKYYKAI